MAARCAWDAEARFESDIFSQILKIRQEVRQCFMCLVICPHSLMVEQQICNLLMLVRFRLGALNSDGNEIANQTKSICVNAIAVRVREGMKL